MPRLRPLRPKSNPTARCTPRRCAATCRRWPPRSLAVRRSTHATPTAAPPLHVATFARQRDAIRLLAPPAPTSTRWRTTATTPSPSPRWPTTTKRSRVLLSLGASAKLDHQPLRRHRADRRRAPRPRRRRAPADRRRRAAGPRQQPALDGDDRGRSCWATAGRATRRTLRAAGRRRRQPEPHRSRRPHAAAAGASRGFKEMVKILEGAQKRDAACAQKR